MEGGLSVAGYVIASRCGGLGKEGAAISFNGVRKVVVFEMVTSLPASSVVLLLQKLDVSNSGLWRTT